MTIISGLLLVLEPRPLAPLGDVTLMSTEVDVQPEERLFSKEAERQWDRIVIHDTRASDGSADSLNAIDAELGKGGLAYHFVVNNGSEKQDGLIEIGYRWQRQESGAYFDIDDTMTEAVKVNNREFNDFGIGIAVVGDLDRKPLTDKQMSELIWLVRQLQKQYRIPQDRVFVQVGSGQFSNTSLFREVHFRQQLFKLIP
ncbi:N-acetylmuramoyl-L-alanine amidase [Poriferisphaera corsica]|uniref:N-acetylmuramoyl-L-alanine amidase n=2 Tax=Poriferisphaera corsica TaxID=2528020 RepID=A0A517YWX8_9BACT|nr:N-acetylmuramoyl-L-alanine amidase [Poriferisphaera corsica]